jgi:hypothetical protein
MAKVSSPMSRLAVLSLAFIGLVATQTPGTTAAGFRVHAIDKTLCETAAVVDVDNDGRLDILACEYWYEAPSWTRHRIADIPLASGYIDNFSDLPVDVDGDGFVDIVQIRYFARRLVWLRNPGQVKEPWVETEIDAIGPTEFAFLVDLTNDGQARELLPQFTTPTNPLVWYEIRDGNWVRHVVSERSYGHGIGAGDVNGDGRTDIVTPQGWFEAPADPRAGTWTFHEALWNRARIGRGATAVEFGPPAAPGTRPAEFGFMHVMDVNQDGRADVVTTMGHDYGVLWFEQGSDGGWTPQLIDSSWALAHASAAADLDGDGRLDLISGKRAQARGPGGSEFEPLVLYRYTPQKAVEAAPIDWTRHTINEGGEVGGGLQIRVADMDGDGDMDIVASGKTGLFLIENLSRRQ